MDDLSYPTVAELERAADANPGDAQALVRLANAYWLEGRGPDLVGEIADRAKTLDPQNRGAWHLWALAESNPRQRTERWRQVTEQFPEDDLARANLADNAAALAGAEHDYPALDLAVETYEQLLAKNPPLAQREALEKAIVTLKAWKF
jgi:tetratricopeptide (TPR) repeat protein